MCSFVKISSTQSFLSSKLTCLKKFWRVCVLNATMYKIKIRKKCEMFFRICVFLRMLWTWGWQKFFPMLGVFRCVNRRFGCPESPRLRKNQKRWLFPLNHRWKTQPTQLSLSPRIENLSLRFACWKFKSWWNKFTPLFREQTIWLFVSIASMQDNSSNLGTETRRVHNVGLHSEFLIAKELRNILHSHVCGIHGGMKQELLKVI